MRKADHIILWNESISPEIWLSLVTRVLRDKDSARAEDIAQRAEGELQQKHVSLVAQEERLTAEQEEYCNLCAGIADCLKLEHRLLDARKALLKCADERLMMRVRQHENCRQQGCYLSFSCSHLRLTLFSGTYFARRPLEVLVIHTSSHLTYFPCIYSTSTYVPYIPSCYTYILSHSSLRSYIYCTSSCCTYNLRLHYSYKKGGRGRRQREKR